jgi:hypothetical protein
MRLDATPLDIARWTADGRHEVLSHVRVLYEGTEISGGVLWVENDGSRVEQCPFLELREDEKYYCGIQDYKPEVCTWHYCERYLE